MTNFKNNFSSLIYDLYWYFATERQNIFFARLHNKPAPWTTDHILQSYKFTNVYRASDRVSQYLINNVIYTGRDYSEEDIVFRILLFKFFNKIETWEKLETNFGDITIKTYDEKLYGDFLEDLLLKRERIYSAAYIMPSGITAFGNEKKHKNHLALLSYLIKDGIVMKVKRCKSLEELYNLLLSYPTVGRFLAFQYAIDINYSEVCNFDEMAFVVAGPGAHRGIQKCFPNSTYSDEDLIRFVTERQDEEFNKRNLDFKRIGNRALQLIDCQNIFCELDKYTRISNPELNIGNTRIKQKYEYTGKEKIQYAYPPKWHCILV